MSVVLAVRAGYIPAFGGNVTIDYALFGMQALAAHFGPSFFFVILDGSYGNNS
jgi:hypothetical protein